MDYYKILGVSRDASQEAIKTAYKKLALKWHPDRNKSPEAEAKFKEINKAYEVLIDKEKRQAYDQFGEAAFKQGGVGGYGSRQGPFTYTYTSRGGAPFEGVDFGGFSDPFDIFEQFFGFQSPGTRARKQKPLYQIKLSFMEAIKGARKNLIIKGKQKKVKIPAGIDDGMRVRFSDFDILVRVESDPRYRREGQDIFYEKKISFPEAVLGGMTDIETLDGVVKVKIRPGTKSGSMLRLRGKGVPYLRGSQRGDFYIAFKIDVPSRVSFKAKELLEKLKREI